jgi:hypothetical protein
VLPDEKELDVVSVDLKSFDEANAAQNAVSSAPSIQAPGASASAGAGAAGSAPPMSESFAAARKQFATIRFAEMIAETRAVLHTTSFQTALKASFDAAFEVLAKQLRVNSLTSGFAPRSAEGD